MAKSSRRRRNKKNNRTWRQRGGDIGASSSLPLGGPQNETERKDKDGLWKQTKDFMAGVSDSVRSRLAMTENSNSKSVMASATEEQPETPVQEKKEEEQPETPVEEKKEEPGLLSSLFPKSKEDDSDVLEDAIVRLGERLKTERDKLLKDRVKNERNINKLREISLETLDYIRISDRTIQDSMKNEKSNTGEAPGMAAAESYGASEPTESYGASAEPTESYGASAEPMDSYGSSEPMDSYGASEPTESYGASAEPMESYGASDPMSETQTPQESSMEDALSSSELPMESQNADSSQLESGSPNADSSALKTATEKESSLVSETPEEKRLPQQGGKKRKTRRRRSRRSSRR